MGLAAAIGGGISSALGLGLGDFGAGILGSSLLGAGTGAVEGGITGQNPLLGALTGAATGGLTAGIGPSIGADLGIGATGGEALTGATLGAGSSALTGGNPLLGAATGGAGPLLGSAFSGAGTDSAIAAGGTGLGADPTGDATGMGPGFGLDTTGGFGGAGASTGGSPTSAPTGSSSGFPSASSSPLTTPTATAAAALPASSGPAPVLGAGPGAAGAAAPPSVALSDPASSGLLGLGSSTSTASLPDMSGYTLLSGGAGTQGDNIGLNPTVGGGNPSFSDIRGPNALNSNPAAYVAATPSQQVSADIAADPTGTGASSSSGGIGGLLKSLGLGSGGGIGGTGISPGLLLGGGLLGLDALMQPSMPSIASSIGPIKSAAGNLAGIGSNLTSTAIPSLESAASGFAAQGSQLASYLGTGTLPPAVQAALNQGENAAKAAALSRYANMGGGAETSSAAAQDIANITQQTEGQGANIALNLLQQGTSEQQMAASIAQSLLSSGLGATGQSASLYGDLLNATLASDNALGGAISNFAAGMVPKTYVPLTTGSTANNATA